MLNGVHIPVFIRFGFMRTSYELPLPSPAFALEFALPSMVPRVAPAHAAAAEALGRSIDRNWPCKNNRPLFANYTLRI
jgi:hypothetical protein